MNKNIVLIGGIILIAVVAGLVYFTGQNQNAANQNATSTTPLVTGTGDAPGDAGQSRTPGVPVVATNPTAAPTDTTAVVSGTVNPNGDITSYWYEFGTTPNLGSKTTTSIVGSGYVSIPTPAYLTKLVKNTTYYFRLVAQNQYGTVAGAQSSVQTTQNVAAPVGGVPTSKTLAVNALTASTASLAGEVNPNKAATQYWFEYGKNGSLGNTTSFVSVGSGSANISASAPISNLSAGTTYYYRINAQNQFGTVNGAILTFKTAGPAATAAPVVTTQVPGSVATTTATLIGTVNPYGSQTTYWFEYSTDSLLGQVLLRTTDHKSAGGGTATVSVQTDVTGLRSGTTYYVRIVAQNSQGTMRGDVVTLRTK